MFLKLAEEHIELVQKERAHYNECLDTSSISIKASFPAVPSPWSCLPANSTDATVHYSLDMAQQVRMYVLKFYTLAIVLGLKQIQKLVFE